MNSSLSHILRALIPYFLLGMSIAFLIGICILLSYVLFWGVIIGVVLWFIVRIKAFFHTTTVPSKHSSTGRVFEHHD